VSIPDKLAPQRRLMSFLQAVVTHGGLRLKYRIIVESAAAGEPRLGETRHSGGFCRSGLGAAAGSWRGAVARAGIAGSGDVAVAFGASMKKFPSTARISAHCGFKELRTAATVAARESAQDGNTIPIQSDVVAGAADRSPGVERRSRLAH